MIGRNEGETSASRSAIGHGLENAEWSLAHRVRCAGKWRHVEVASGCECDEPVIGPADFFKVRSVSSEVHSVIAWRATGRKSTAVTVPPDADHDIHGKPLPAAAAAKSLRKPGLAET